MKKLSPLTPFALLAASLACLAVSPISPSEAAPSAPAVVRLPGQLAPSVLGRAALLGRKSSTDIVPLTLTLPLRDPSGLARLIQRQYAPGDPLFHHFITPAEFADRFCPTAQTYNTVAAFARSKGLIVTGTHSGRLLLDVSGPVSVVEAAFQVRLQNFVSPDGSVFHAPSADPAIPMALAGKITGVLGLENAALQQPQLRHSAALPGEVGSGPDAGLTPTDIKAAYNLSTTTLNGKGQTLGLLELDAYSPGDIISYESSYGLRLVPLHNVPVDGGVPTPGGGAGEVTLDIELMAALAPGVAGIYVYEAPDTVQGATEAYARIANDDIAKEVSTSWGLPENELDPASRQMENVIFQQMASQGQSLYAASADHGAYDNGKTLGVDDPASQPYVTGVGGTSLNVVSPGGAYEAETTWNDLDGAGGGGVSIEWPVPDYQKSVSTLYSSTRRNVPDVSLDGDPETGYSIYFSDPKYGTGFTIYGGTSCAAPLWAAYTALVNEQRELNGEADLGFPNPTIYQIAEGPHYGTAFHDIKDRSTNLYYQALPGYDNATGWGTFNGAGLLAQLAPTVVVGGNPVSSLTLTPASVVGGLTANGMVTLANPAPDGGAAVTLTLDSGAATVASPTVTVPAGGTTATFVLSTSPVTASTSVSVTAAYSGGSQSAILTVTPPPAVITPLSLTLAPDTVGGGAPSIGTVSLTGPAPAGGLSVALASSSAAATVPTSVAVPAGAVSATFPIASISVTTQVVATISATLNGGTQTATLTVQAPELEPVVLTPASVIGGDGATAALSLTFPAPTGGALVTLTSSSPVAALPASVTIPAGQTTLSVPITTSAVAETQIVTITAVYNGVTQTAKLTVQAVLLEGLSLAPASVVGGASTVATLSLGSPAPAAGLNATLSSSDPAALVPATLFIPPGATAASVVIPTASVSQAVQAVITANVGTGVETATLSIQPVQVASLTLAPPSVVTGTPVTGTLILNAPAPSGGLTVLLSSSGPAVTVPASVLVPAGTATASFTAATPHAGGVTLSASLGGAAQTAALTVTGAPGTTFPAGLNLISAPYDYSGMGLDTLFGYSGVVLGTWQTETGAYALTPAAPADTMHLGRGYWVNLPNAVTLSTVGTPATAGQDFTISLSPGWNQIGQPWTTSETVGSLTVSAGGGAALPFEQAAAGTPLLVSSLVYRYAPASGKTPASYIWVRDGDTLQPGLGYWVYAYQAVTLTFPHP